MTMNILQPQQFPHELQEEMFSRAEAFDRLRRTSSGRCQIKRFTEKTVVNIFCAASPYLPLSFRAAERLLGAEIDDMRQRSHVSFLCSEHPRYAEHVQDAIKVVNTYFCEPKDGCIVLHHEEDEVFERAVHVSRVPIINAEDPTQALIDMGTIRRRFGTVSDLTIIIAGDLTGRTGRSLAALAAKFKSIRLIFASPPQLRMTHEVLAHLDAYRVPYAEHDRLDDVISFGNVVYMTSMQHRMADDIDPRPYRIDARMMRGVREDAIIMHSRPCSEEIDSAVDADPRAWYLKQTAYSIPMCTALLELAMGGNLRAQTLARAV